MSDISVSFEFTPPYNPDAAHMLSSCAADLTRFEHDFISVNFGGGLVPKERAFKNLKMLGTRHGSAIVAHLISTGLDKLEINEIALSYKRAGINKIIAVRGNPELCPSMKEDGSSYANAIEMMRALGKLHPFQFLIIGYPEGHPTGAVYDNDIDDIKAKIDAGATEIITQFCFDNERILRFKDQLIKNGISVPLRIGILPLSNIKKTYNLARQYKISMPENITERLFNLSEASADSNILHNFAAHFTLTQIDELVKHGFNQFHFYTLNQKDIILTVCAWLGIKSRSENYNMNLSEVS